MKLLLCLILLWSTTIFASPPHNNDHSDVGSSNVEDARAATYRRIIGDYDENIWGNKGLADLLRKRFRVVFGVDAPGTQTNDCKVLHRIIEKAREEAPSPSSFPETLAKALEPLALEEKMEDWINLFLRRTIIDVNWRREYYRKVESQTMDLLVAFLLPDGAEHLKAFESGIAPILAFNGRAGNELNDSAFRDTLEHVHKVRLSYYKRKIGNRSSKKYTPQPSVESWMIKKLVPKLGMKHGEIKNVFDHARQTFDLILAVEVELASVVRILLKLQDNFPEVIFKNLIHKAWSSKSWDIVVMLLEHSSYSKLYKDSVETLLDKAVSMAIGGRFSDEDIEKIVSLILKNPHAVGPTVDKYYTKAIESNNSPLIQAFENRDWRLKRKVNPASGEIPPTNSKKAKTRKSTEIKN